MPDPELQLPKLRADGWIAESALEPFVVGSVRPGGEPRIDNRRVFLENKYINERFEYGIWNGVGCVVKHSTKAAWSIGNEYRLSARMYAQAPALVPAPLAWWRAPDDSRACIVIARVPGPSLTDLIMRGLSEEEVDTFTSDILALADALKTTGIVHRDLFADNLLLGADGHLKAIDWQLAIDRNHPEEDPWVVANPKFRYVVFGVNRELGLGIWNDFSALSAILARFPQTPEVRDARCRLDGMAPMMKYCDPPRGLDRIRLWAYGCSLRFQMLLRGKNHRKYVQLERRWRTVRCKWS